MISVLIPIYNYAVTALVSDLKSQADKLGIAYEIRCYDDASESSYKEGNSALSKHDNIVYAELTENLGRAAIRNKLAKEAVYDNLIFLDCDSAIIRTNFLQIYLEHLDEAQADVIAGGRFYNENPPSADKYLHWKYGTERESRSLALRKANPQRYFHSNNFLVHKAIITRTPFDESISGYGYEDLLLAKKLYEDQSVKVQHIDNPIEHLGIEDNSTFLLKTKTAVQNLKLLNQAGLELNSKLETVGNRLRSLRMAPLYRTYYKLRKDKIEKNLLADNPNLRFLDYYKLQEYLS